MIANSELNPYDEVAYPSLPISHTHPDRMATVGMHFGMRPAPVDRCRVLELGCSSGANLLAMAVGLPESEFVGVDRAAKPIARGKEMVEALGLKNLTLRQADLLEMAPDYGKFDYIIAHGLYTWVPAEVRDKILAICKASLEPQGIAYVSYDAFPGSYARLMVREMMLFHIKDFRDPQQQLQQAVTLMKLLAESHKHDEPYRKTLQGEYERMSTRAKEGLYHDELSRDFQPFYFHQFMENAQRHGLQFLGEADFSEMQSGRFAPQAKKVLEEIADDVILREQYLDFMDGRAFRRTLVCHDDVPLDRSGKSVPVKSFYVSTPARPKTEFPDLSPGAEETFRSPNGTEVVTTDPLGRSLFWYLVESRPERVPFVKLARDVECRARLKLGFVPKPEQDTASEIAEFIWRTYTAGLVELHVHVLPAATQVSERPVASPLARLEARDGNVVTTLHCRSLHLGDGLQRGIVMLLDGTRDRAALRSDLLELFKSGKLTIEEGGQPVVDMKIVEKRIDAETEQTLQDLARTALLVK
jgi:methyltransferase-like protein/cyclopropane fatty-acyl-phospholipid synthase-like methyltransferase